MNKIKRKYSFILLLVGLICFVTIGYVVKNTLQAMNNKATTVGTITAIYSALNSELNKRGPILVQILTSSDQEWKFLSDQQYDRVIIEIDSLYNIDPPKGWNSSQPLLDPWGNRYEIAYRQLPNQNYDYIVVSKGPDKIYGTKDDMVSPHGVVSPARSGE
ncbi:MAG: hypothetical protein ACYS1A_11885 [Planctomycetota bacterium]|jgi:hypothetical protein